MRDCAKIDQFGRTRAVLSRHADDSRSSTEARGPLAPVPGIVRAHPSGTTPGGFSCEAEDETDSLRSSIDGSDHGEGHGSIGTGGDVASGSVGDGEQDALGEG